ncbi:MAG: leucyl aminopeptidase [Myxococcota bacterium]
MLKIQWTTEEPQPAAGQVLAVPVRAEFDAAVLEARFGASVRAAFEAAGFKGKASEVFDFTRTHGDVLERVLLLGAGDGLVDAESLRQLGHDAVREAAKTGSTHIVLDLQSSSIDWNPSDDAQRDGRLFAQGLELGTYAYDRFLSDPKPSSVTTVTLWASTTAPAEGTDAGQVIAAAIARARDLANGPAELVTPTFLADTAKEIVDAAGDANVSLTVLDKAECEARNMGCYLGVAKGSAEPPKFIHLTYTPKGTSKGRIVLVGKGVTFDSGGYSIKPTAGMLDMKLDMSGSAAVIGAFQGLVKLGVAYEVHVLVAATENMVSGHAYRLGDVLTASNGKTVEVNNTDAEGRLTMADALIYGSKLEPDLMIDFATLTGACIVALGPYIAGVMTEDERLAADWMSAADRSGELMWRLPLQTKLKEQLQSKIADMKNTGERFGGALTAGLFLSEFIEGKRWMHVDIAGPAMASKAHGVTTPGGSGFPVATILEMLLGDIQVG